MALFENVARKTTVVLTFGEDTEYEEKVSTALSYAGSVGSPITTEKWLAIYIENMTSYSGIIILGRDISKVHEPEVLGEVLSKAIVKMGGRKPLPFSSQRILICKSNSSLIIRSFSEFHNLELEENFDPRDDVFFWSIIRHNELQVRKGVLQKIPWYQ